jgi:hypothetical protein
VQVAERELLGVLLDESLPAFGSYLQPSVAEAAALDRAVGAICREAHRLDLRAEQLVIGVKAAWSRIAAERKHRLGERDGDVLRTIVSWSIEVFFDSRATVRASQRAVIRSGTGLGSCLHGQTMRRRLASPTA